PHGDMRQLRQDGERQAGAFLSYVPARLLPGQGPGRAARPLPDRARPRDRPAGFHGEEAAVDQALHSPRQSAAALGWTLRPDTAAIPPVLPVFAVHQLPAVLRGLPAVRPQAGLRRPRRPRAASPLQLRLARPRLGGTGGDPERRGRGMGLHARGLLLRGVPQGRGSRSRHQPEQGEQHDGLLRREEAPGREVMAQIKTYVRPMDGWWRRNPYFVRYMVREGSSVFLAAYAVILLIGLLRLSQGPAAWDAWRGVLGQPLSIVFHWLALLTVSYHAY